MMYFFNIERFEECRVTGIVSFVLRWNFGHGEKLDQGAFTEKTDYERYVASSKRSWILLMFGHFVNHARILFETGSHDFYRKESKITALERCIRYNDWFQDKSLEAICKVILKLDDDMRRILPTPANPSRDTSESRIIDMMLFCKKELHLLSPNQTPLVTQS